MTVVVGFISLILGIGLGFLIARFFLSGRGADTGSLDKQLAASLKDNRLELSEALKRTIDSLNLQISNLQMHLGKNFEDLRKDNHAQLDRIRKTVDEQLQATLENKLSQNAKRINAQLQAVDQSLGSMKDLASNVGELQKTLHGVKTKGVWGEAHLENLLSEVLNSSQYVKNYHPYPNKKSSVEFALKIPSETEDTLYLPIDAKFPWHKFQNLQAAADQGDLKAIKDARADLKSEIKKQAKKIAEYINPPSTTNFAIMYLPVESLYAEIVQQTDLIDQIRLDYKIIIVGPNTVLPMISLVGIGYKHLAIKKHTASVWEMFHDLQKDFSALGGLLSKANSKIDEAGKVILDASKQQKKITGHFKKVEEIDINQPEPAQIES